MGHLKSDHIKKMITITSDVIKRLILYLILPDGRVNPLFYLAIFNK